jgi:hypothetical protein
MMMMPRARYAFVGHCDFSLYYFFFLLDAADEFSRWKRYKMNDAKTPKKAEAVSKVTETTKTEVTKTTVDKAETTNAESKSVDNSTTKSASSPKSAAQSSISHFSSVSTPQYRSGWDTIFGNRNDVKEPLPEEVSETEFPMKLEILDGEVDVILRDILDEKFIELAKKHRSNVSGAKSSLILEYNINCQIKEKKSAAA